MLRLRDFLFWWQRVRISIDRRGMWGTARLTCAKLRLYLTPSGRRERHFDAIFGTDTSGRIAAFELGVTAPSVRFATEYRPTPIRAFVHILERLHLDHREWVFIDLGAGKGRALLLAAQFPFKRIIGVEFAEDLARTARRNVATCSQSGLKCPNISVVCQDAAEYRFPSEKLVIYLNNPFRGAVMKSVVERIGQSLLECPRELYVVYWNPFCAESLDGAFFLEKSQQGAGYLVYTTTAALRVAPGVVRASKRHTAER